MRVSSVIKPGMQRDPEWFHEGTCHVALLGPDNGPTIIRPLASRCRLKNTWRPKGIKDLVFFGLQRLLEACNYGGGGLWYSLVGWCVRFLISALAQTGRMPLAVVEKGEIRFDRFDRQMRFDFFYGTILSCSPLRQRASLFQSSGHAAAEK